MPEPLDLDEIKERVQLATEGPWEAGDGWVFTSPVYPDDQRLSNVLGSEFSDPVRAEAERQRGLTNAEFIAHAREDVPALIARITELEAERDAAIKNRDEWASRMMELASAEQARDGYAAVIEQAKGPLLALLNRLGDWPIEAGEAHNALATVDTSAVFQAIRDKAFEEAAVIADRLAGQQLGWGIAAAIRSQQGGEDRG